MATQNRPNFTSRLTGGVAALGTVVGALSIGFSVLSTQGLWFNGYVSEAGVPGKQHVTLYHIGIGAVGLALILLAISLGMATIRPVAWLAALSLSGAGFMALASGAVPCTNGCPLPPEESTARDIVHAGVSTLGVALVGLAILFLAFPAAQTPLQRWSRRTLMPLVPLGLLAGYMLLFVGRSHLFSVVERLVLLIVLAWMAYAGVMLARGFDRAQVAASTPS